MDFHGEGECLFFGAASLNDLDYSSETHSLWTNINYWAFYIYYVIYVYIYFYNVCVTEIKQTFAAEVETPAKPRDKVYSTLYRITNESWYLWARETHLLYNACES